MTNTLFPRPPTTEEAEAGQRADKELEEIITKAKEEGKKVPGTVSR